MRVALLARRVKLLSRVCSRIKTATEEKYSEADAGQILGRMWEYFQGGKPGPAREGDTGISRRGFAPHDIGYVDTPDAWKSLI